MYRKWFIYFFFVAIAGCRLAAADFGVRVLTEQDLHNYVIIEDGKDTSGSDAYIRKIKLNDDIYILKQINNPAVEEQFLLINDCVASTIGHKAGIPVNQVCFVPYNVRADVKQYPERAATLHTYIAGIDLENKLPSFLPPAFTLRQAINTEWNRPYWVEESKQGLQSSVIESMGVHKELSKIAAFDTFVGNPDRSYPNIFYDAHTSTFYGIDHAAALSKNSAAYALKRLNELVLSFYFNEMEKGVKKGLHTYYTTLKDLYDNYQPSMIIENMNILVPYIGLNASASVQVKERIYFHAHIIEHNYREVLNVIHVLKSIN